MWLSQPKSFFLDGNRKVSIERNFLAPNIDSPITATITIWKSSTISHRYNYPEILSTTLVNSKKKNVPVIRSKNFGWKKRKWSFVSESGEKTWFGLTQSHPISAGTRPGALPLPQSRLSGTIFIFWLNSLDLFVFLLKLIKLWTLAQQKMTIAISKYIQAYRPWKGEHHLLLH